MRLIDQLESLYYVKSRCVGVNKVKIIEYCKIQPKPVADDGTTIQFFCDILYPYLGQNHEMMIKLCLENKQEIDIPLNFIESIKNAGWPRAGMMAERLIDFPWRLLKPIHAYLKNPKDIVLLEKILYKEVIYDQSFVTKAYHDKILPWIELGTSQNIIQETKAFEVWMKELIIRYDDIVIKQKELMLKAFSIHRSGYPYTGVIVDPKYLKNSDNPFQKYLSTCVKHQKAILDIERPAVH
jgi:hypothetical protein